MSIFSWVFVHVYLWFVHLWQMWGILIAVVLIIIIIIIGKYRAPATYFHWHLLVALKNSCVHFIHSLEYFTINQQR